MSEASMGFEAMTSVIRVWCSTKWAMKPHWKQVYCTSAQQKLVCTKFFIFNQSYTNNQSYCISKWWFAEKYAIDKNDISLECDIKTEWSCHYIISLNISAKTKMSSPRGTPGGSDCYCHGEVRRQCWDGRGWFTVAMAPPLQPPYLLCPLPICQLPSYGAISVQ